MRDADPFDEFVANILETKCELEPSPLSAALLSHKKEVCWQVLFHVVDKRGVGWTCTKNKQKVDDGERERGDYKN